MKKWHSFQGIQLNTRKITKAELQQMKWYLADEHFVPYQMNGKWKKHWMIHDTKKP